MKIAAFSDVHIKKNDKGKVSALFGQISEEADVCVMCGDLTDTGSQEEAVNLAEDAKACTIPILAVLGNHDYEGNQQSEIKKILAASNIIILENESKRIKDVEFYGLKGFAGGFDNLMLASWGEPIIKDFVRAAVEESLHLDSILSHSESEKKVVIMHYSPIRATVIGEPEEIYPFLGSSHYEEVINRRQVSVVFHGHAHRGTLKGKTKTDIQVFNVCQSLLSPEKPFHIMEI